MVTSTADQSRDQAFSLIWAADAVSRAGDAVSQVAVPLLAITQLGAGPGEIGLLGVAQLAPIVALTLPAGAWVDQRSSLRRVLMACDLVRAAALATIPVAWLTGRLGFGQLLIALLVSPSLRTVSDVAFGAYVPRLDDRLAFVPPQ